MFERRPSKLHGMGIFATEDIREGTVWYRPGPGDLLYLDRDQFEAIRAISPQLADWFSNYAFYVDPLGVLVFQLDGNFVNHSDHPNSALHEGGVNSVALRDIRVGEEILEDYSQFSGCPWVEMYRDVPIRK